MIVETDDIVDMHYDVYNHIGQYTILNLFVACH